MKLGFLITARLKSSRLPKKLLHEVQGENYMTWMIRRLKLQSLLDEIVICTSTNPQDDPLEEIAQKEGVKCFRGSEEDVFQRLNEARKIYELDYVINMTADCPLLPFDLIPKLVDSFKKTNAELIKCHHLPVGLFLSGLSPAAMERLIELKASDNTEYWLHYFLKSELFDVRSLETEPSWQRDNFRIALDYPEDHEMLKATFEGLGEEAYKISTEDLIHWLDKHPEIVALNKDCGAKGVKRTEDDPTSKVKLKDGRVLE